MTGVALGKTTISVTDGYHTASINIDVCEYLQYYEDMKESITGGLHAYKTGSYPADGVDTSDYILILASDEGNYTTCLSNNIIDFRNISKLEFNYRVTHNYGETLTTIARVGISSTDSNDLDDNWIVVDSKTSNVNNYTNKVIINCNDVTSGYLKLLIKHGTETTWFTAFLDNYYILAKP